MKNTIPFIVIVFALGSCAEFTSVVQSTTSSGSSQPLTEREVVSGLKAALEKGIELAAADASKTDGFFGNSFIKIPFPPDAQKAEDKLRQIGLGNEVDNFILSLNRAAEQASSKSVDVFMGAIRQMTFQDAWAILRGEKDAATQYLMRTTTNQLTAEFKPIVASALNSVNATKYYSDLAGTYNKIPLVTKVDTDLEAYATERAIDGLFQLVAREEAKIREDPIARTTAILQRVFGYEG